MPGPTAWFSCSYKRVSENIFLNQLNLDLLSIMYESDGIQYLYITGKNNFNRENETCFE